MRLHTASVEFCVRKQVKSKRVKWVEYKQNNAVVVDRSESFHFLDSVKVESLNL